MIYVGAQCLFRSNDHGDSWVRISPDLTTNDQGAQKQLESDGLSRDNSSAENYTTIISVSESPKNPNVIWAGTDDGNLQVTKDGGNTWTNGRALQDARGHREGGWLSGEEEIRERLAMLYGAVNLYDGRPTDPELHEAELVEKEIGKKSSEWDSLAAKELAAANKALAAKKLEPIKVITREEWNKKAGAGSATAAAMWWLTNGAATTMDEED